MIIINEFLTNRLRVTEHSLKTINKGKHEYLIIITIKLRQTVFCIKSKFIMHVNKIKLMDFLGSGSFELRSNKKPAIEQK